jgi:hypothetical protein
LRDSAAIVVTATWTWREGWFNLSNVHSALLYPNRGKAPLCRILGVSLGLFWSVPQITGSVFAFNPGVSASKTARPLGFLGSMRGRVFGAGLMVPKYPRLTAGPSGWSASSLPTCNSCQPHTTQVFIPNDTPHPFSRQLFMLTTLPSILY